MYFRRDLSNTVKLCHPMHPAGSSQQQKGLISILYPVYFLEVHGRKMGSKYDKGNLNSPFLRLLEYKGRVDGDLDTVRLPISIQHERSLCTDVSDLKKNKTGTGFIESRYGGKLLIKTFIR